MILEEECPLDIVGEATELASRIRVDDIPLDFDPGDMLWQDILGEIARQFSNHGILLAELDGFLVGARAKLCDGCERLATDMRCESCSSCSERWLAEHHLWEAALDAAEKAYQRWLARQALRRAGNQEA